VRYFPGSPHYVIGDASIFAEYLGRRAFFDLIHLSLKGNYPGGRALLDRAPLLARAPSAAIGGMGGTVERVLTP
jgi:hypothetical protein